TSNAAILHLSSSVGASRIVSLNVNSGSQLDLAASPLIVAAADSATKSANFTQLTNFVTSGGITSSTVTASPTQFGIAVADNAVLNYSTYNGHPVDANSVIVVPTFLGDANVDGRVDLTDLSTVLNNFGTANLAWTSGNFDNAATIDLTDLS